MTALAKLISASLLAANAAKLGEECQRVLAAGADRIHLDVMDNHYVPNLTFGPLICESLRAYGINALIDVHLMTCPVDSLIAAFAKAGANLIVFHPEASLHVDRSLQLIRDHGCQAGLAFNPATNLACLEYVQDKIDEILIMSVNPGFGGQAFMASSLKKISVARHMLLPSIRIAVDGGIHAGTLANVAQAGADTFVIGSGIFKTADYSKTLQNFRNILDKK